MSKYLTLIRHAKSSWTDSGLSDFERPLNKRGFRDAPVMADYFSKRCNVVSKIVSSPAMRAKTTAEIFAKCFQISENQIQFEKGIYEASADKLIRIISEFNPEWEQVVMFGHNPGFSYLASLLTSELYSKPTCSISEIELHIENWNEIMEGMGTLKNYDFPKKHSELQ